MPHGTMDDRLIDPEEFAANVETCAKLLGLTLESVATKADILPRALVGFKLGDGKVTSEIHEAVANVLQLAANPSILTLAFEDQDAREDRMQLALLDAGVTLQDEEESNTASEEKLVDSLEVLDESKLGASEPDPPMAKPDNAVIGRNIRAAIKKAGLKLMDTLQEAGINPDKMFMAQYEKGKRGLTDAHLQSIATQTNVDLAVLYSGRGLESYFSKAKTGANALVPVSQKVNLPPVSSERVQEFFKGRVLNIKTEPAEEVTVGQLLQLASKPDEVDWPEAWLRMTASGAKFATLLDRVHTNLKPTGDPVKILFVTALVEKLWPESE